MGSTEDAPDFLSDAYAPGLPPRISVSTVCSDEPSVPGFTTFDIAPEYPEELPIPTVFSPVEPDPSIRYQHESRLITEGTRRLLFAIGIHWGKCQDLLIELRLYTVADLFDFIGSDVHRILTLIGPSYSRHFFNEILRMLALYAYSVVELILPLRNRRIRANFDLTQLARGGFTANGYHRYALQHLAVFGRRFHMVADPQDVHGMDFVTYMGLLPPLDSSHSRMPFQAPIPDHSIPYSQHPHARVPTSSPSSHSNGGDYYHYPADGTYQHSNTHEHSEPHPSSVNAHSFGMETAGSYPQRPKNHYYELVDST